MSKMFVCAKMMLLLIVDLLSRWCRFDDVSLTLSETGIFKKWPQISDNDPEVFFHSFSSGNIPNNVIGATTPDLKQMLHEELTNSNIRNEVVTCTTHTGKRRNHQMSLLTVTFPFPSSVPPVRDPGFQY